MATRTRLELVTSAVTGRHSNQLNHRAVLSSIISIGYFAVAVKQFFTMKFQEASPKGAADWQISCMRSAPQNASRKAMRDALQATATMKFQEASPKGAADWQISCMRSAPQNASRKAMRDALQATATMKFQEASPKGAAITYNSTCSADNFPASPRSALPDPAAVSHQNHESYWG